MDSKTKRSLKADEIRLQEQTEALNLIPSRDLPYPLVLFCNFVAIPRLLMVLPRRVPCSSEFQSGAPNDQFVVKCIIIPQLMKINVIKAFSGVFQCCWENIICSFFPARHTRNFAAS